MGLWVLGSTAYQTLVLEVPRAEVMRAIGFLAPAANLSSVLLLLKYRNGDANLRSVWLCSRNDALGNLAVVLAAAGIWSTTTAWPDLIVAGIMASLFLAASVGIIRQAAAEIRGAAGLTGAARQLSRRAAAAVAGSGGPRQVAPAGADRRREPVARCRDHRPS